MLMLLVLVSQELEIPLDSEELHIEDADAVVEDDMIAEAEDSSQPMPSPYDDDSEDRTRIGMHVDDQVDLETDAAFAAIGAVPAEEPITGVMQTPKPIHHEPEPLPEANTDEDPFGLGDTSFQPAPLQPEPMPSTEPKTIN